MNTSEIKLLAEQHNIPTTKNTKLTKTKYKKQELKSELYAAGYMFQE